MELESNELEKININGYKDFLEKSQADIEEIMEEDEYIFIEEPMAKYNKSELYIFEVEFHDELPEAIKILNGVFQSLKQDNFNAIAYYHLEGFIVTFLLNNHSLSDILIALTEMIHDNIEEIEVKEYIRNNLRITTNDIK